MPPLLLGSGSLNVPTAGQRAAITLVASAGRTIRRGADRITLPSPESARVSDRIDTIRRMLESEPDDAFLRYSLGYELAKAGEEDEAIQWFDRALEVDPEQHYAAFQKARALDALDRTEEAVAVARAQATRAQAGGDAKAAGELLGLADELED